MPSLDSPTAVHRLRARVLAVDDDAPFLALLEVVLRASNELETAGEAESGERAIELADELRPEIVLMDVRMPGMGGIPAAKRIKASHPSMMVLLFSTTPPNELPREADDCGADAVIWKSELGPGLLDELWIRHRDRSEPAVP
jgi:DNA-binding NarL/FixJ family response regulator